MQVCTNPHPGHVLVRVTELRQKRVFAVFLGQGEKRSIDCIARVHLPLVLV